MPILVVEDSQDIRELLVDALCTEGYTVFAAQDGLEALELLPALTPRPTLILLDLMMPRMTGWEFRTWQRAEPAIAAIPVIVLSAATDLPQRVATLDVAAVLPKPFSLDTLLDTVAQVYRPLEE